MPTLGTSAYADSLKFAVAAADGDTLARLFDLDDDHARDLFDSLTNENYVRPLQRVPRELAAEQDRGLIRK
jgi:hypothetical protein